METDVATVRFYVDHIFTPPEDRRVSVKYLGGKTYPGVRRACADDVVAKGKGEIIETPPRHPLDHDGDGRKGGSLPKSKRARRARPTKA
jgi:hypothetical protein